MSLAGVLHEVIDVLSGRQARFGDAAAAHEVVRKEFGEPEPQLELTAEEKALFAKWQAQQDAGKAEPEPEPAAPEQEVTGDGSALA